MYHSSVEIESVNSRWLSKSAWLLPLLLALAGCVTPVPAPQPPQAPAGPQLPEATYMEAARKGAHVYRIETAESRVLIKVGRAGKMKNLGHDHVIASEDVDGLVMLQDDPANSRADLLIPLQRLIVDKTEYREQMGLEGEVSASAIEGTSSNMQNKVLESDMHPWAQISAHFASAQSDPPVLDVSVTLHGATHEYRVPVELQVEPERLAIKGEMTMQHSDFGLTPFSAAGGLLKVAEQLELQFMLVAHRL
jgi:polyisoprenoid-binding protein YceI